MNVLVIVALSILFALGLLWLIKLIWLRPFNINHFYERSMLQLILKDPEILTMIGILERFGLNFHNDDLTDESDAHFQKLIAMIGKNLKFLRSYPRDRQTPEQQLSTDILDWYPEFNEARSAEYAGMQIMPSTGIVLLPASTGMPIVSK